MWKTKIITSRNSFWLNVNFLWFFHHLDCSDVGGRFFIWRRRSGTGVKTVFVHWSGETSRWSCVFFPVIFVLNVSATPVIVTQYQLVVSGTIKVTYNSSALEAHAEPLFRNMPAKLIIPEFNFKIVFAEVENPEYDENSNWATKDDGEGGIFPGFLIVRIIFNNNFNLILLWSGTEESVY